MVRTAISQKQEKEFQGEKSIPWSPSAELKQGVGIADAILECLMDNDPEGVMEMVEIYLKALNKTKLREKNKMAKSTMFHALRKKNPTIKTLAKIMSAFKDDAEGNRI